MGTTREILEDRLCDIDRRLTELEPLVAERDALLAERPRLVAALAAYDGTRVVRRDLRRASRTGLAALAREMTSEDGKLDVKALSRALVERGVYPDERTARNRATGHLGRDYVRVGPGLYRKTTLEAEEIT